MYHSLNSLKEVIKRIITGVMRLGDYSSYGYSGSRGVGISLVMGTLLGVPIRKLSYFWGSLYACIVVCLMYLYVAGFCEQTSQGDMLNVYAQGL